MAGNHDPAGDKADAVALDRAARLATPSNRRRAPESPTAIPFGDALRRAQAAEARADDPATSDDDRDAAILEADAAAESLRPASVADVRYLIGHVLAVHGEAMDVSPLRQLRHALAGLEALAA